MHQALAIQGKAYAGGQSAISWTLTSNYSPVPMLPPLVDIWVVALRGEREKNTENSTHKRTWSVQSASLEPCLMRVRLDGVAERALDSESGK